MEERLVKYNNRKLYSYTQKSYVTHADIQTLLKEGKTVNVVDENGTDITADVLKKVVAKTQNLTVGELQNLIQND